MHARNLTIGGAWEFTPVTHDDARGSFLEWYKAELVADTIGHRLSLAQANHSISARGVVRGVHFAAVPPSQAKYVYCPSGAVLDVIVDIRVGSPTFGAWDAVRLDDVHRRAVYIAEGLGHAFCALQEGSIVTYLCSTAYSPGREFGIDPLDPELALPWPAELAGSAGPAAQAPVVSDKDRAAPSLREAEQQGLLPSYDDCLSFYASLCAP